MLIWRISIFANRSSFSYWQTPDPQRLHGKRAEKSPVIFHSGKRSNSSSEGLPWYTSYPVNKPALSITDPLNKTTRFDYDINGNQTKVTYPTGNTVENGYNVVNRETYEYDPNGNVTKETDHLSDEVTTYAYDADKLRRRRQPADDEGNEGQHDHHHDLHLRRP
jgi:YD repeat-containing protein